MVGSVEREKGSRDEGEGNEGGDDGVRRKEEKEGKEEGKGRSLYLHCPPPVI